MRLNRKERRERDAAWDKYLKNNPPKMPADFSHKDWKRVVRYARSAFCCGYSTAMNDYLRGER